MNPWILNDGTKVHLGGSVEGNTIVADHIRSKFARIRNGESIDSDFGAIPHGVPLDLDQAHLIDSWLRMFCIGRTEITSSPEFETPVRQPRPEPPPGCVY